MSGRRSTRGNLKDVVGRVLASGIGGGGAPIGSGGSSGDLHRGDSFRSTGTSDGDSVDIPPELKEEEYFRFGDLVSLFLDESFGFVAADGLVDTDIYMAEGEDGASIPSNFKECIFRIDPANQYTALKVYKKNQEAGVSSDNNDPQQQAHAKQLRLKMEEEKMQNIAARERAAGTPVAYGQPVQLTHVRSKKYLTVARESAELQKDCMRLTLDAVGNSGSCFYILPVYKKIRSEGDSIHVGDQVYLFSRKFGQYIHASSEEHRYPTNNKREVNISTSVTRWRLHQFAPYQGVDASLYLSAGSVISLYHREIEGHLSATDSGEVYVHVPAKGDLYSPGHHRRSTNYYWEIESEDSSKGGIASWNTVFRFRHLATGRYLCAGKIPTNATTTATATTSNSINNTSNPSNNNNSNNNNSNNNAMFVPRSLGAALRSSGSGSDSGSSGNILRDLLLKKRSSSSSFAMMSSSQWNLVRGTLGIFDPSSSSSSSSSSAAAAAAGGGGAMAAAAAAAGYYNDEAANCCELFTTDNPSHATLFVIHPPSKQDGFIWRESNIRLRHQSTNTWVHSLRSWIPGTEISVDRSSSSSSKGKNDYLEYEDDGMMTAEIDESTTDATIDKYYKINTSLAMHEEDVFSIEFAPDEEVDQLNRVLSTMPAIERFLHRVRNGEEIRSSHAKALAKVVASIIIFCTAETDVMDPFTREGVPVASSQQILRERRVIDLIMDVLRLPFERGYLTLELLEQPSFLDFRRLFTLCYRLVRHFLRSNKTSGLYMSPYIRFIQTQIGYRLGAEDTLMELFKDNYELLQQQVTSEQIFFFIDIIAKTGKQPRYITFLSALCSCEGRSVSKNQDIIVELLLENANNRKDLLILPQQVEGNTIYLSFKDEHNNNNHNDDDEPQRVELQQFCAQYKGSELLEYFEKSIELMAKLCEGRNKRATTIISELMTPAMLLSAIKNAQLPPTLRSSFLVLFMHAYVDSEPFQRAPAVVYTRMWDSLDKKGAKNEPLALGSRSASVNASAAALAELQANIKDLKDFFIEYYRDHTSQDSAEVELNQLTYQITVACRNLFELGFYSEMKEIRKLINVLFQILDGRDDRCSDRTSNSENNNNSNLLDARYEKTVSNQIVHQIKIEVLKIFNYICDYRLNDRITNYLSYFKHQYTNNLLSQQDEKSHHNSNHGHGGAQAEEEAEMFEKLFGANRFRLDSGQISINVVLLDLMLYKNTELQTAALHLLFRDSSQKEELSEAMQHVEILVSDEMVRAYNKASNILNNLRTRIHVRMKGQAEQDAIGFLDTLIKDMQKGMATSQRILRNLQAHKLVIDILYTIPFDPNSKVDQGSRREIFRLCYLFLTLFVKDNPINQKLVFPHLSLILTNLGSNLGVAVCAQEIVANNRALCSSVEEKHIRMFVNAIAEKGKYSRYLNFLKTIVYVDGKAHKDNQTAVLKALMEREKDVIILFKDPEGMRKRDLLMKQREHEKNPDESMLYYHVSLLELLAACAEGKNHVTEVKLQSLIGVEHLIKQITAKSCIPFVRDALLMFIDEVYINTRKKCRDVETSELLWSLFRKVHNDVSSFIANTKADPMSSARDNNYIFNIALPFVRHYFDIYCPDEPESSLRYDNVILLTQLGEQIVDLFYITANAHQREQCFRTVKAMHDKGLGTRKEKISALVKKNASQIRITAIHGAVDRSRLLSTNTNTNGTGTGTSTSSGSDSDTRTRARYSRLYAKKQSNELELIRVFERYTSKVRKQVLAASDFEGLVDEFSKQDRIYLKQLVKILRRIAHTLMNGAPFGGGGTSGGGSGGAGSKDSGIGSGGGGGGGGGSGSGGSSGNNGVLRSAIAENEMSIHLAVSALDVLRKMITRYDEDDLEELRAIQNRLNNCGVSKMLLDMFCTGKDEIVRASLQLGIALLNSGNFHVQRKLYKTFLKNRCDDFFLEIKRRIAMAKTEIKERRLFMMKKGNEIKSSSAKEVNPAGGAATIAGGGGGGGAAQLVLQLQHKTVNDGEGEQAALFTSSSSSSQHAPAASSSSSSSSASNHHHHHHYQQQQQKQQQKEKEEEEFSEKGFIKDILRLIQLFCEGHYAAMQNFMREQTSSTTSINIIQEIIDYLSALQRYIDRSNIHIAKQLFITLTELVQGPCEENQIDVALRSKLFFVCAEILADPLISSSLPLTDIYDLKNEVLLTLISILEGNKDPRVPEAMLAALKMDRLRRQIMDIKQKLHDNDFRQEASSSFSGDPSAAAAAAAAVEEEEEAIIGAGGTAAARAKLKRERIEEQCRKLEELGIRYHFLINTLRDSTTDHQEEFKKMDHQHHYADTFVDHHHHHRHHRAETKKKSLFNRRNRMQLDQLQKDDEESHDDLFKEQTGRIEIVREGVLERVYFRIPDLCQYLTKKTRDNFVETVNRNDGPPGKIEGLTSKIPQFLREMEHQQMLSSFRFSFIRQGWSNIKFFSFVVSIIINILVFVSYTKTFDARNNDPKQIPIPGVTTPKDLHGDALPGIRLAGNFRFIAFDYIVMALGLFQLLLIMFIAVVYTLETGIMTIVQHWKPAIPLDTKFSDLPRNFVFYLKCVQYLVMYDHYLWFLTGFFIISVLGFVWTPLWYSAHLLEVVVRFPTLFNVLKSIYSNIRTLVLTGVLALITIFIFSNFVFTFFEDYFFVEKADSSLHYMCPDVLSCVTNIFNYGLRSGGWWEDALPARDPRLQRIIFDMLFYILVAVILLNMVFGAILDTFGELRKEQNSIEEDIKNRCFICHIESSVFDRKANEGISFKAHIKEDHNMWNYVYFFIYLYRKDRTEYTGTEQYIADKIANQDYSFFPAHRSLVLEESESKANNLARHDLASSSCSSTGGGGAAAGDSDDEATTTMVVGSGGSDQQQQQHLGKIIEAILAKVDSIKSGSSSGDHIVV